MKNHRYSDVHKKFHTANMAMAAYRATKHSSKKNSALPLYRNVRLQRERQRETQSERGGSDTDTDTYTHTNTDTDTDTYTYTDTDTGTHHLSLSVACHSSGRGINAHKWTRHEVDAACK